MPDSEPRPDQRVDRTRRDTDDRTGRSAAAARIGNQASWVDQQIRVAMANGDFDDLPGYGKPLKNLTSTDPNWWVKNLIEREQITGVLPPSLQLRKEDAELDDRLDKLVVVADARREVEDFNARVIRARYTPAEGPPLVTMPRDVDETLAAWEERRQARAAEQRARLAAERAAAPPPARRRWWRRSRTSEVEPVETLAPPVVEGSRRARPPGTDSV